MSAMGYGGSGDVDKIVAGVDDVVKSIQDAAVTGKKYVATQIAMETQSYKLHRAYKQEEKLVARINAAFLSTNYGGAHVLYQTFKKMIIVAGHLSESHEEHRARLEQMSFSQLGLYHVMVKFFRIIPWGTELYDKLVAKKKDDNKWNTLLLLGMTRTIITFISLLLVITTIITILGLLSIAFQGMDSPLYDLSEKFENLHNVVQGLTMSLSGEGEGNIFDVLGASLIMAGIAAAVFSGPFGLLVGIAFLAAGVFNLIYNATDNLGFSLLSTGYLMGGFLAIIASGSATILQFIVMLVGWLSPAVAHAIYVASFMSRMVGFGTILGGLFLLLGVATGKWSDEMAIVSTIFAGILFYMGALVLGIATLPVAIFFAGAIVIAWLIRKSDWTKKWVGNIIKFIIWCVVGLVKTIIYLVKGLINAITDPIDWIFRQLNKINTLFTGGYSSGDSNFIGINSGEFRSRASGGPVSMGSPYMVGERGPEMFVPGSSGTIVPTHKMGGNNITLNINVSGVTDRTDKRALAREISDMISQEVRRSGGQPTRGRF